MFKFGLLSQILANDFLRKNKELQSLKPGVYLDLQPMKRNLVKQGWPRHIREAIVKAFQKPKVKMTKKEGNVLLQRLGTILEKYEAMNPELKAPWAAPDHPINYDPLMFRNYGIFRGGNILY